MYPAPRTVCRLQDWQQHRRRYAVGRGSNLYFDFTIDYAQELAFRRANGDYLREGQWKDLTVEVYII